MINIIQIELADGTVWNLVVLYPTIMDVDCSTSRNTGMVLFLGFGGTLYYGCSTSRNIDTKDMCMF